MYHVNVFLKQSYTVFVDMLSSYTLHRQIGFIQLKMLIWVHILHTINIWLDNVTVDIGCATILHYSIETLILH